MMTTALALTVSLALKSGVGTHSVYYIFYIAFYIENTTTQNRNKVVLSMLLVKWQGRGGLNDTLLPTMASS